MKELLYRSINGDWHEALNDEEICGSADLIVADPWYFDKDGRLPNSSLVDVDYFNDLLSGCCRLLNSKGSALIFNTFEGVLELKRLAPNAGLQYIDLAIWSKTNPPQQYQRKRGYSRYDKEWICWLSRSTKPAFNLLADESNHSGIYSYPTVQGGGRFSKPIGLIEDLVMHHSSIDGLTLELFGGCRPVLEACKDLHRSCISYEIEESKK